MDRWRSTLGVRRRTSRRSASTAVGTGRKVPRKGSLSFGGSVIVRGAPARARQRRRSACSILGWRPRARSIVDHNGLLAVRLNCCRSSRGRWHTMRFGCWRSYDFMRPVLKHGPRSLTWVRVGGWQTLVRREIEIALALYRVHGWQRGVLLFSA